MEIAESHTEVCDALSMVGTRLIATDHEEYVQSVDGAREVAEEAIGPSIRDGVCYSETRLSRKSYIVPLFTEILSR